MTRPPAARPQAPGPARVRVLATVLAALLAACGSPVGGDAGTPQVEGSATATTSPGAGEGAAGDGGEASPTEPATPGQDPATTTDDGDPGEPGATDEPATEDTAAPDPTPVVDDFGPVGANGRALLNGRVPRLVVEVDFQDQAEPDQEALDHLVDELSSVVDKPGGIRFAGGNSFASDQTVWRSADLRRVAETNRSTASTTSEVSVYVLYVRGQFFRDSGATSAIGVAYNASETALFPEQWRGVLGGLTGSQEGVEAAVLVHEIGHLFGLVNLTGVDVQQREDPEHPGHSRNRGSVMFHAIETTAVGQVFDGPPPDRFDAADRDDLDVIRGD